MNDLKMNFSDSYFSDLISIIKIGAWNWNLKTSRVIYSPEWCEILGYDVDELAQDVSTWEKMVIPEDLEYANEQIAQHLSGKAAIYEAEFRMERKDGSIIWAQDKGKVVEFDTEGKPLRLVGVLQDVSRLKNAEMQLKDSRAALDLAVNAASLGTWDWDIPGNRIKYNDEYLQMLGYTQNDIDGSIEEWENMNHPEDLPHTAQVLNDYMYGKIPEYECEIRMKHKNGKYVWTRDVGRILERDADGNPTRIIGGHLNIDALKRSQEELRGVLEEVNLSKLHLESEIEKRTAYLTKQDKMLWSVNEIAKKLLSYNADQSFADVVHECLELVGNITSQNRVYIWRDLVIDGVLCCVQTYEWVHGVEPIQGIEEYENVPYEMLPNFKNALKTGKCLNNLIANLSDAEKEVLSPQGIKTILIAPISINGKNWGFIGVDNCENEKLFSELEENMLLMSGFLLANAILKRTNDEEIREAEERVQLMLNATPLCCNLWNKDLQNIACNDEAVRLFGMSSQQEYLENFFALSPEYQPDGELSDIKALRYIKQAFSEGLCKFEWLHQDLNKNQIPAEITLVRVKYKDDYIVAGYTRDLRELKANEAKMREAEERVQLMLNATPLCCSLWNKECVNIACNDEAIRLFGLSKREDYFERFYELSPEYQPCGMRSDEKAKKLINQAFEDGYLRFEWVHQSLNKEPIPSEVTLVRVKYKDEYIVASYTRDMRELKANEEKMREAEERIQLMFNSTPLGCNMVSKNFRIIACNDEAVRLFNLSSQQDYLDKFFELSPEYQPCGERSSKKAIRYMRQALAEGYLKFEWLHQRLDGEEIPAEITLVRIKHKNEFAIAGYVRDLREIKTMLKEIHKAELELRSARDEALAHSRAKSEFLAKMSHEIRTPMNAIVGMSELILRESIPPVAKEHAVSIKQASANLLAIINDILDFSKIESGKLEIVNDKYTLSSVINDVINIIRIRMIDSHILFAVNIDSRLPDGLIGDETRFRQIILNVLNNAVKYTKEGHISLSIGGSFLDKDALLLQVDISDSGIGIKDEDLPALFGEFIQFDASKNRGVEGTGLGLAITKNLCKAMGGDISVSSVYGKGSTFTIKIPQKISDFSRLAEVKSPKAHNVLVYESREVYLNSLVQSLANLGVQCTAITKQSEFNEALRNNTYSFIFLSSFLYEYVKMTMDKLGVSAKLAIMAEHGENFSYPGARISASPMHAISIANILNDVKDESYNGAYDGNIFIATNARVLIVDDISTNLKVAEGLIAPYCMQIDTCESGMEAIILARENNYDIIFMDHMMPVMNGVEATLAIRDLENCRSTPIVALTANAVSGVKEMFLSNGFNDFLPKPIEMAKLNEILDKWIPKSKKEKYTVMGKNESVSVFKIEGVNVDTGIAMTGGSVENYLKILSAFYKDGLSKITDLKAALDGKNISLFTINVHALKSALASIGANQLSDYARALELAGKNENVSFIYDNIDEFLRNLDTVLENIKYVVNTNQPSEGGDLSFESLREQLTMLKQALIDMDGIESDRLVNELLGPNASENTRKLIEKISEHILMCNYDEAIDLIDGAINNKPSV